ncbi:MAG: energy transducer TonB, partial [Treponema sp.]|nr:energy transducer TonB [Treponema sp.]
MNDNSERRMPALRLLLFAIVAAIHVIVILFLAFNVGTTLQEPREIARVMRLTDFTEIVPASPPPPPRPPPPPPMEQPDIPMVEAIAEVMIEVETVPDQMVVAPGTLTTPYEVHTPAAASWDDFLPIHQVTSAPRFNDNEIAADLVFPPIALRSGIEGRVILELFVDRNGMVQLVRILREDPEGRGFGE